MALLFDCSLTSDGGHKHVFDGGCWRGNNATGAFCSASLTSYHLPQTHSCGLHFTHTSPTCALHSTFVALPPHCTRFYFVLATHMTHLPGCFTRYLIASAYSVLLSVACAELCRPILAGAPLNTVTSIGPSTFTTALLAPRHYPPPDHRRAAHAKHACRPRRPSCHLNMLVTCPGAAGQVCGMAHLTCHTCLHPHPGSGRTLWAARKPVAPAAAQAPHALSRLTHCLTPCIPPLPTAPHCLPAGALRAHAHAYCHFCLRAGNASRASRASTPLFAARGTALACPRLAHLAATSIRRARAYASSRGCRLAAPDSTAAHLPCRNAHASTCLAHHTALLLATASQPHTADALNALHGNLAWRANSAGYCLPNATLRSAQRHCASPLRRALVTVG